MPRPPLLLRSPPGIARRPSRRRPNERASGQPDQRTTGQCTQAPSHPHTRRSGGRRGPSLNRSGSGYASAFAKALGTSALLTVLLSAAPDPATAAPGAFTTPDAFAAANPESLATFDFESIPGGTDVSGTTLVGPDGGTGGITLPGPLADVLDPGGPSLSLRVVADAGDNPASSGSRSLGVGDPGNFDALTAGTTLDFSFPEPVLAFGLTIITPEEPDAALFDDDLLLLVPGESTASLALSDGEALGTFGGRAYRRYFLGVVGAAPFSSARLEAGGATPTSGFFYNVDDLRIPLPEPGAASALLVGSAFLLLLGPRRGGSVRSVR
ncbi:MAG: hypothetical protein ACX98W_05380, partial [bacterium]